MNIPQQCFDHSINSGLAILSITSELRNDCSIELLQYKSATLRLAQGKLRRNCSKQNRTLNGASQQTFNRSGAAGNHKKILLPFLLLFFSLSLTFIGAAQDSTQKKQERILYGTASFYSNKFQGRKTANGEIFDQNKMTAACNVLPLGTWIRVTNLRNKRSVVVKTNDRLHTKMKRIVDLSRIAASKLGYIGSGLTRVKVEVLGKKKPAQ